MDGGCASFVTTYRDIWEDGRFDVVAFVTGRLAAGEQSRSLALAMLNVTEDLLKLFLINLRCMGRRTARPGKKSINAGLFFVTINAGLLVRIAP